jgi:hypothetical protein
MNYTTEVDDLAGSSSKEGQTELSREYKEKGHVSFHEEYDFISKLSYEQLQSNPILDIAARIWDREQYKAARVCYRSMRIIDDLIDNRKKVGEFSIEEKKEFTFKIKDWIKGINKSEPQDAIQEELLETINKFQIPLWPFQRFAKAMIYDINNDGFDTFQAFLKYSEGAAISPASIFVHLSSVSENDGKYHAPQFDIRNVARPAALF